MKFLEFSVKSYEMIKLQIQINKHFVTLDSDELASLLRYQVGMNAGLIESWNYIID